MKKISTLYLMLFLATIGFAQHVGNHVQKQDLRLTKQRSLERDVNTPITPAKSAQRAVGDTIVYYDFNGGLQGWANTTVLSAGTGWVFATSGSSGQYSGTTRINSTTGANGFLKLDGDGHNTPTPGAGFDDSEAYIESPTLDLSNESGVVIELQEYFRLIDINSPVLGTLELGVSNDNGATWTDLDIRGDVGSNDASANPVTRRLLVSQYIGGAAQAKIRLKWANTSHYFFMADDILILKQPKNDLGLVDVFYNTTADTATRNTFYKGIPLRHANVTDVNVGVGISNIGLAQSTNVIVDATLSLNGSSFSNTVSSAPLSLSGTTVRFDTSINMTTSLPLSGGVGNYSFNVSIGSDSTDAIPSDNAFVNSLSVTDSVYRRDDDNIEFITQRTPLEIVANYYEILRPDTVKSATIFLGSPASNPGSTSIGASIKIYLYDSTLSVPVAESDFYNVTSTGFLTIPLLTPTAVAPGAWFIALESVGDSVWIGIDDRIAPLYTTYENIGGQLGQGGNWFFGNFGNVPYLRMNLSEFTCPVFASNANVVDAQCGQADGSITVAPTGGEAPYTYAWSNGSTGATLSNITSGTYTVTISDGVGCSSIQQLSINDAGAPTVTVTNTVIDSCFQGNNGSVAISTTGGTGTISLLWSTGDTTNSVTGLSSGEYTVTATDGQGCKSIQAILVGGPNAPVGAALSLINGLDCNGDSDAEIQVAASGGTPPYSYLWSNGETSAIISNLTAGTYVVTTTDANGCTFQRQGNLAEPAPLTFQGSGGITYNIDNTQATINAVASGGTAPYLFSWTGPNGYTSANQSPSGLTANGTYNVQVTDANGCVETASFDVIDIVLSVNEINLGSLVSVYPNPTTGLLNINGEGISGEYTVQVQNVLGATVYSNEYNFSSNVVSINLNETQKGVYFIQLINAEGELEYMNRIVLK